MGVEEEAIITQNKLLKDKDKLVHWRAYESNKANLW